MAEESVITKEQAEKLLKGDMANMVKAVESGKPLSAHQRSLLQQLCGANPIDPVNAATFVKTKVQLAKALGTSRPTIDSWLKMDGNPGRRADGRYDVGAWRGWANHNGVKGGTPEVSQTQAKAVNILLQNEKLRVNLAILRKEYVPVADVEKWVGEMITQAKQTLLPGPASLAPQVVGVSVIEAEDLLRRWLHEALSQLHQNPLGNGPAN